MNPEWWMIAVMTLSGAMFAIGGTGPKYVRRFILPVLLGVIALLNHQIWWACLGYASTQILTLCLPYGSKTPYWLKAVTFITYALPSLFFGFSYWQIITPVVCIGIFFLSNQKWSSNTFVWKICEFIMGLMVGLCFVGTVFK